MRYRSVREWSGWPSLTLQLTALMLAVYVAELAVYHSLGRGWYGILFVQHPDYWLWPLFWTPFTNLVSHNVLYPPHLANLLFFIPLGVWGERRFSRRAILFTYFGLGAVASTIQVMVTANPANGSSAAITALAGAWFMETQLDREWGEWKLVPWAVPLTLVILVALPEVGRATVVGFERIGHWSHLAGFVLGAAAYPSLLRERRTVTDDA